MAQPIREAKAEQIVQAMDDYLKAYVARYVHMATNDEPVQQARRNLADLLATAIK